MEEKMDLRIQKTYLALHNAFTSLLKEKYFEDLTVNELCEHAMIRRTTFYKHFADKYDYFAFYLKEICYTFRSQLPSDGSKWEITEYLSEMCRELIRFIQMHERLVNNLANSSMFSMLYDILAQQISMDVMDVIQKNNPSKKLSTQQLEGYAAFYSGGLINTLWHYIKTGKQIDEHEFLAIINPFVININA